MTVSTLLAGLLAAGAVPMWGGTGRSASASRLAAVTRSPAGTGRGDAGTAGGGDGPPSIARLRSSVLAAATCLAGVGIGTGDGVLLVGAVSCGGAALWFGAQREVAAARRRRAEVRAALPVAADLLAACLSSGAPPTEALATVADSTTGPLADRLRSASSALRLGADGRDVWGPEHPDDPLAPLVRGFVRSNETGARLAETVAAVADEQRRAARWSAEAAARRAGVLAVGPLAVCFLPAFVLIGVVPVILAVAGEVLNGLR